MAVAAAERNQTPLLGLDLLVEARERVSVRARPGMTEVPIAHVRGGEVVGLEALRQLVGRLDAASRISLTSSMSLASVCMPRTCINWANC